MDSPWECISLMYIRNDDSRFQRFQIMGHAGYHFEFFDKKHDETCHKMCGDRRDSEQM
jgi:hypothetical protein